MYDYIDWFEILVDWIIINWIIFFLFLIIVSKVGFFVICNFIFLKVVDYEDLFFIYKDVYYLVWFDDLKFVKKKM